MGTDLQQKRCTSLYIGFLCISVFFVFLLGKGGSKSPQELSAKIFFVFDSGCPTSWASPSNSKISLKLSALSMSTSQIRCQDWIDFFQVSSEHIKENSLVNLRVCMKHFKEKVTMINGKVTRHPSMDSVNSNQSSSGTKRSRHSSSPSGWNGVGSAASSIHSDYTSDSESRSKSITGSATNAIQKLPIGDINGGNRKLFVITQSDENIKTEGGTPGQKSKMFLILENGDDNDETKKHQKITLIADKSDAQTAERIEQLLPQLIQRIQYGPEQKNPKETLLLIDTDDEDTVQSPQDVKSDIPIQIQRVETLANVPAPKAVNLSPDFLFLMKMVPKLEAIAEPIKSHIKDRIESMLEEPLHEIAFEDTYIPNMGGIVKNFSNT